MGLKEKWTVLYVLPLLFQNFVKAEEAVVTVNCRKTHHVVSDLFISISVDPALLLTNLNFSSTLQLARQISPAFIRITGPSTNSITWSDQNDPIGISGQVVTPAKWIAFNEFAMATNLTPIFALNDRKRVNGVWDPRESLAMMTLTDKMNYSCYWELGYECSEMTLNQYVSDIVSLSHILDAFPSSNEYWGTIGSDFSGCLKDSSYETLRNFLFGVEDSLDAINWHVKSTDSEIFLNEKDSIVRALSPVPKTSVPVMVSVPQSSQPTTFIDGLKWATQLGDAAKYGFEVIFRQPRVSELFQETPAWWISLLHKHLMGRNVLDVKLTAGNRTKNHVYAHCAKHQNIFARRGAMTIFAVNTDNEKLTLGAKFIGNPMKYAEVQIYILTSSGDVYDSDIFLNGQKMTRKDFIRHGKIHVIPKIRRTKANRLLTFTLPPQSIGFFVLPGARVSPCITGEDELDLIVEEIREDQEELFEDSTEPTLIDLHNELHDSETEKEIERNEVEFIEKIKTNDWKKVATDKTNELKNTARDKLKEGNEFKNYILKHAKIAGKQKEMQEKNVLKKLTKVEKQIPTTTAKTNTKMELELSSAEIRKILMDRAKNRIAEKRLELSSDELNDLVMKAAENFETLSESDEDHERRKRFIPVNMLKAFAEKEEKRDFDKDERNKGRNGIGKVGRTKREVYITDDETKMLTNFARRDKYKRDTDINFGGNKKRSRGNDNRNKKKHNDEEDDEDISYMSPKGWNQQSSEETKVFPHGDVVMDIGKEDDTDRNMNYDYIEDSDESGISYEDMMENSHTGKSNHGNSRHEDRKANKKDPTNDYFGLRKTIRNERQQSRKKGKKNYEDIKDGMELIKQTQRQDEWLDVNAEDQYYHAPNEYYENFEVAQVNIRNEWMPYGELFEIDSIHNDEKADHDGDDVNFDDIIPIDENEYKYDQGVNKTKHQLDDYLKETEHLKPKEELKDYSEEAASSSDEFKYRSSSESEEESEEEEYTSRKKKEVKYDNEIKRDEPVIRKKKNKTTVAPTTTPVEETTAVTQKKKKKRTTTTTTPMPTTQSSEEESYEVTTPRPRKKKPKPQPQMSEQEEKRESDRQRQQKKQEQPETYHRRSKRHIDRKQLKHVKEQFKQKHEYERHVRKVEAKDEKRYIKQLKHCRHKREVSDVDSIQSSDVLTSINLLPESEDSVQNSVKDSFYITENENTDIENIRTTTPSSPVTENYFEDGPLRFTIGRPFDQQKQKPLDERRVNNFQKYLRNRLARRRIKNERLTKIVRNRNDTEVTDKPVSDSFSYTTERPETKNNIVKRLAKRKQRDITEQFNPTWTMVNYFRAERIPRGNLAKENLKREILTSEELIDFKDNNLFSRIPVLRSLVFNTNKEFDNEIDRKRRSLVNEEENMISTEKDAIEKNMIYKPKYAKYKFNTATSNGKKIAKMYAPLPSIEIFKKDKQNKNDENKSEIKEIEILIDDGINNGIEETIDIIINDDQSTITTEAPGLETSTNFLSLESDSDSGSYQYLSNENSRRESNNINDDYKIRRRDHADYESSDNSDLYQESSSDAEDDTDVHSSTDVRYFRTSPQQQSFSSRNLFVGGFLNTVSTILDRLHQRLFGYLNVFG